MPCPSGVVVEVMPGAASASNVGVYPMEVATCPEVGETAHSCPLGSLVVDPGATLPIPVW